MVALYVNTVMALASLMRRFENKAKGATAVEYGIMVAAIAGVIVGVVFLIGEELLEAFDKVLDALTGATP